MTRAGRTRPSLSAPLFAAMVALAGALAATTAPAATSAVGTILFVVINSASLNAQESAKKALMEGWGYTVTPITASSSQAAFDAAVRASSCAYVSETITSGDLGTKLVGVTIGVVSEEQALSDEFGFSTSTAMFDNTAMNVTNTSHYITSQLVAGTLTIWNSSQGSQGMWAESGTLGGFTTLARKVGATDPVLTVMDRTATLTPSGTAAGRRVNLPWGSGVNINSLATGGRTIMQRSIEWCLMPVAWYKLDDAAGSTAADSAGGYHGTRSGGAWTTGKLAGGLSFNGSNDYVSINDATAFQVTDALTIAGWVKTTAAWNTGTTVATVLRKGDSNPNNWQLDVASGRVELLLDASDGGGFTGNTTLAVNTWYHVAATWDGASVRIYVNGVADNTPAARAAPIGTDTRDVYLGGRIGSTDVIQGVEDDVRFYNRCLTPAEIAALASSGKPTIMSWENVDPASP
ncbi:MAG TPA: LamG domain-containing protein [Phycisphaerales bacterium]|nr:LamG domain-containing protein [Phycisphaerales bacterium]